MKRRKFIQNMAAAAPLLAFPSVFLSACKKENVKPNGYRVLVAGAGMAGLAAARMLTQNGFEVVLLEGRDRAGGRVRTDRSQGFAFDEGASWIHGPTGNPLKGLADDAGADSYVTNDESLLVYDQSGALIPDNVADPAYRDFEDALQAVVNSGNLNSDFASVFESLYPGQQSADLWKYMLSAYLEFDAGGDISRLSSLYFVDDEAYGGKDRIITNGYDKMTDYLARDLDIRLNTRITEVDYSGAKVRMVTDQGDFEGDFAVITLPLGVLKSGEVAFGPALPANKLSALNQLEMGTVNKFLFTWDAPFWDTNLQYFGYTPATKGKFNYFLNMRTFSAVNGLMTFAFGDYSLLTETMDDAAVTQEVMGHLRAIFGNSIDAPKSIQRTRWNADPFSYGAYSFTAVGGNSTAYNTLATEVEGKLFFAGEHTSKDYRGTVHGAYLSGEREAQKIIDLL